THWLEAWWQLLALTCTEPDQEWSAVVVARAAQPAVLGPLTPAFARAVLADALALRQLGLSEPLPLPPKTAGAYALRRTQGRSPDLAWEGIARTREFESDHLWELFHGPGLAQLRAAPAQPDEHRGPDRE